MKKCYIEALDPQGKLIYQRSASTWEEAVSAIRTGHYRDPELTYRAVNPETGETAEYEPPMIKAIIKAPGERYKAVRIVNELETFQTLVGGWIETVTLNNICGRPLCVICNEEGRLMSMAPSAHIGGVEFVGPVVVVGVDGDEFTDVPDYIWSYFRMDDSLPELVL